MAFAIELLLISFELLPCLFEPTLCLFYERKSDRT